VDGFGHVVSLDDGWPARGAELVWQSPPGGRGRVRERVVSYTPREGQLLDVQDTQIHGRQTVRFAAIEGGVRVELELDYELKQRYPLTWLLDLVFVRREITASLRRTLAGFARERRGDVALEGEASR
jgi:hypothetical protein